MPKIKFKVINIQSEQLCRSAEDDFFYFDKINSAYKKLKQAVQLTPEHFKSTMLLADAAFIKGRLKEALQLYIKASEINSDSARAYAAAAGCFSALNKHAAAAEYCDKALALLNCDNYGLLLQVFELKISALLAVHEYEQAFKTWQSAELKLRSPLDKFSCKIDYELLNKKSNLQKRLSQSNLKIVQN